MTLRALAESDRDSRPSIAPSPRPTLIPGELLAGKYRIDSLIAEGGMGLVMRATHLDLDCPVAIKVIRAEYIANEDVAARLFAEARIAASLRSKHVNRVLDVGRTQAGVPFLVLEYLSGSDLSSYLRRRERLAEVEAVDYVVQTCEALAEAHAVGIVHRDLKPENLFLSEEADGSFVLKVLDFGISKSPRTPRHGRVLTLPSEVVGSPPYMSPEQVRATNVDARADIWALGALLHELCTGVAPFDTPSLAETFGRILDEQWLPPALQAGASSEALDSIIAKCLRRNADERYQDVVELARALAPLSSDPARAERVAKVAAAARARVISGEQVSEDSRATPLAMTSSQVEVSIEQDAPSVSRRRLHWWPLAAAAALLLAGSGYAVFALNPMASAGTGSLTAASLLAPNPAEPPATEPGLAAPTLPEASPPASAAPSVGARAATVKAAVAPKARAPWVGVWRPQAVKPQASASAGAPSASESPEPAPSVAPTPASTASNVVAVDAWNVDTFGGRR